MCRAAWRTAKQLQSDGPAAALFSCRPILEIGASAPNYRRICARSQQLDAAAVPPLPRASCSTIRASSAPARLRLVRDLAMAEAAGEAAEARPGSFWVALICGAGSLTVGLGARQSFGI